MRRKLSCPFSAESFFVTARKLLLAIIFIFLAHMTEAQPASTTSSPSASSKESTDVLLSIYAEVTGRTILRPMAIPGVLNSTNLNILTDTNRIAINIEEVFTENGFEMTRIGESFVRVMRSSMSNSPTKIVLDRILVSKDERNKVIPAGEINFSPIDIDSFLNIYAELKHRTVLRPTALPSVLFVLRTQKPLTQEEVIYALETLLVLNGLVSVEDGDKFVQIIPLNLESQTKTNAPKPNASSKVIEPKNVPVLKDQFRTRTRPPQTLSQAITNFSAKAYTKAFGHPPGKLPPPMADRLGEYYAELADKRYAPSPIGKKRILFEARTPLTKEELMYAIGTTLRLNDLRIIENDEKTISIGPVKK